MDYRKFLAVLVLLAAFFLPGRPEQCTTAVFSGRATFDGRPILWKNRDTDSRDNKVIFLTEGPLKALAIITVGNPNSVWMGVNEAGLAIINTDSDDLEGSSSSENGIFMKRALLNCPTVASFEDLLRQTNSSGRLTRANYGVIDALGAAAYFETGNHTFTKFDATNLVASPHGFLVRTNFAFTGDGTGYGKFRYDRAMDLLTAAVTSSALTPEFILRQVARDLVNDVLNPYPLPYKGSQDGLPSGYIRTANSINRFKTRSAVVFQGVLPGEDPRLTTMWVMLGEPVCTVALPLWLLAGSVPAELNGPSTAPFGDTALQKKDLCYPLLSSPEYLNTRALDDAAGGGIFRYTLPIEDWVMKRARLALQSWRETLPSPQAVAQLQNEISSLAYACFVACSLPHDNLQAPRNLTCWVEENRSLLLREYIHYLTWQPPAAGSSPASYRIYEIKKGERTLLGEIPANRLSFIRRNIDPAKNYVYAVLGVDKNGQEGNPAIFALKATAPSLLQSAFFPIGHYFSPR